MDGRQPAIGGGGTTSGAGAASASGRRVAPIYERVLRPLLFGLDAETAHRLSQAVLGQTFPWALARTRDPDADRLSLRIGGHVLASPIGLAAGFDKNGDAVPGLRQLGFGYLTIGSILPEPSAGHPRPRLIRNVATESMVNCYGLPSDGLEACVARFRRLAMSRSPMPLIANVHTDTTASYEVCVAALAPYVQGVELALRCPNRADPISVFPVADLDDLLGTLRRRWPALALFVKLPPYTNEQEKENRLELVERAIHFDLTGITIPGNWTIADARLSRGQGSLSGRPTFANNLKIVREMAAVSRGRIAIKASGGVHTGEDAFQLLEAGASMIDIFTAFVFRGWNVVAKIEAELLDRMDERGIARVSDLVGGPRS
jgi:dihydroorotate dehydrogenase